MSRRLGLLVSAALLSVVVAVFIWMRVRDEPNGHHVGFTQTVDELDLMPAEVPVDPNAAVATIHAVRAQFGSVLANTELDVVDAGTNGVDDDANGPNSFEDFLNEAAGLTNPPPDLDVVSPTHKTEQLSSAVELAQSLRDTAALLVKRAQQADESGDVVQQQRYFALAALLRAEADLLATIRQASR